MTAGLDDFDASAVCATPAALPDCMECSNQPSNQKGTATRRSLHRRNRLSRIRDRDCNIPGLQWLRLIGTPPSEKPPWRRTCVDTTSWKRLFLRLPERCEACGAHNSVSLQSTEIGTIVALRWSCSNCLREWATTTAEAQPDRRSGTTDSRWTAADRRRAEPFQS